MVAMPNRLIGDARLSVPSQPAGGGYGYDWVGNRLNPPSGANQMQYNSADQLVSWPGMHGTTSVAGYAYDGSGNLSSVRDSSGYTTVESYTYTPAGLLDTASYDSRTLSNTWDADGNRIGMSANGSSYSFVYDASAGIPAVVEEDMPGGTVYYYREPDGELLARQQSSTWNYYHFDALGSTRLLTDGIGTVTDRYAYDAYGALISHDKLANSVEQPYQYVGRLGYYTHYQEPCFGLMQLGVRLYEPQTGRFTQRDRAEPSGSEAYAYADGNPVLYDDPQGTDSMPANDHPLTQGELQSYEQSCENTCDNSLNSSTGARCTRVVVSTGGGFGGPWGGFVGGLVNELLSDATSADCAGYCAAKISHFLAAFHMVHNRAPSLEEFMKGYLPPFDENGFGHWLNSQYPSAPPLDPRAPITTGPGGLPHLGLLPVQ